MIVWKNCRCRFRRRTKESRRRAANISSIDNHQVRETAPQKFAGRERNRVGDRGGIGSRSLETAVTIRYQHVESGLSSAAIERVAVFRNRQDDVVDAIAIDVRRNDWRTRR